MARRSSADATPGLIRARRRRARLSWSSEATLAVVARRVRVGAAAPSLARLGARVPGMAHARVTGEEAGASAVEYDLLAAADEFEFSLGEVRALEQFAV